MTFDVAYFLFRCTVPWFELSAILLMLILYTFSVLLVLILVWFLILEFTVGFDAETETTVGFDYIFEKGYSSELQSLDIHQLFLLWALPVEHICYNRCLCHCHFIMLMLFNLPHKCRIQT
jgi:hypothetical protein